MVFKNIIDSNRIFAIAILIFILVFSIAIYERGGKDLKVSIYGAQQTLHKESPYKNPQGPDPRPLFRYAPGFAIMVYPFLLESKMYRIVNSDLQIDGIGPSVFAWYFVKILLLLLTACIMLKIIPSVSKETSIRNLKISLLAAVPFIACELTNSQNKIIALFFMLLSLWLFEEKRLFISALCFNIALTIYSPLIVFVLYFLIRKKEFILSFIVAAFLVFFVLPALVFGVNYNIQLLKEWFTRTLKPFSITNSYATYTDLRRSSQSLPSAIGRMFVSGHTNTFRYLISPIAVHVLIRTASAIMLLVSCVAVLKRPKATAQGLGYAVFFILALLLPQYCITYTWSWALVFYFAIFNYVSYPEVPGREKKLLIALAALLFIASLGISSRELNQLSVLFWSTVFLWAGLCGVLLL